MSAQWASLAASVNIKSVEAPLISKADLQKQWKNGREEANGSHSNWFSRRGCTSQLLVLTGPFESECSVYIAVIVARLIMNPGLRIFGAGGSPVALLPLFSASFSFEAEVEAEEAIAAGDADFLGGGANLK